MNGWSILPVSMSGGLQLDSEDEADNAIAGIVCVCLGGRIAMPQ